MVRIWPQEHNLDKLGRGLLDDATCLISRPEVLWFQTRVFCPNISLCDPCGGDVFGPGFKFEQNW